MTTNYTIYLVNESASTQVFWAFLAQPEELASDPGVYANSSTSLAVPSMSPAINTFTIPVQYIVGAGASNNAVGLNIRIDSSITENTDLGQMWDANYATVPPNMGPTMNLDSSTAPSTMIGIKSNAFNQAQNEANGWFSNMSYGIQTAQGFIGMSWSPSPQTTRTLTPKLQFYVATGSFGSNTLASWTDVSNNSAQISVPGDFQYNKTTVTLTATGGWTVTPGAPPAAMLMGGYPGSGRGMDGLVRSHMALSEAHADLIGMATHNGHSHDHGGGTGTALATRKTTETQQETVKTVKWETESRLAATGDTYLEGTLTVGTAVAAVFATFLLSGVEFSIRRAPVGGTTIEFSYSGSRSAAYIRSLLTAGAQILLRQ